jgi:hypothetical protein
LARIFGWSNRELAKILDKLGSLFERHKVGIAPFHKSLRDWFADPKAT